MKDEKINLKEVVLVYPTTKTAKRLYSQLMLKLWILGEGMEDDEFLGELINLRVEERKFFGYIIRESGDFSFVVEDKGSGDKVRYMRLCDSGMELVG